MKTLSLPADSEEQASLWAARLEGAPLTPQSRAALDAWLAAHPDHRALLSQYCQFSADLEKTLPAMASAGLVDLPAPPARRRAGWSTITWFAGGAIAAAAATVVAWSVWPSATIERHATPAAQRQTLDLADGSRVELNARTSVQIEITRAERRVRLADGQAFFAVTKDPARPFIVETPAGSVRVTGTKFDVRSESAAQLEVIVAEGSVQVRAGQEGAAPIALTARDRLTFTSAGGITTDSLTTSAIDDALAWREGRIVFAGVTVRAACERFARDHGRGIAVTTAVDASGHTLGARYPIDDLKGFLDAIETTWPDLRVTHETNGTVRVSLRNQ
ncbi:MAG: FecR domain-containing protein [Verrucomicrobia bacterium]|nr:FecR domain-containing protein [Verrucomicrobiota bacterium]